MSKLNSFLDSFLDDYYSKKGVISENTNKYFSNFLEEKAVSLLEDPMGGGVREIHFEGPDFMISADELDPDLARSLKQCGGSGDASHAVDSVIRNFSITANVSDAKKYLQAYGAWEDEELDDHRGNVRKLVWLAGSSLAEDGEAHFSTY